jgi:hypothetical protein
MKKLIVSVFIAAVALMMPANLTVAGDGVDENIWYPFHIEGVDCDGVPGYFDGVVHVVYEFDVMKNGYKVKLRMHSHGKGYSFDGEREYIWTQNINETEMVKSLPYSYSYVVAWNVIDKGQVVDERLHVTYKVMIDKDLNVKVLIENVSYGCY